mgnify:CR=1 FL=1
MLLLPMRMIEWIRLISIGLSLAAGLVILPWRRFYQNPFLANWLVAHALVFGAFFRRQLGTSVGDPTHAALSGWCSVP